MAGTVTMNAQFRQLSSFFGFDTATLTTLLQTPGRSSFRRSTERDQATVTLSALVSLQQRLDEMFTSHAGVERWLHGPSGYFGGDTPFDHLSKGQIDRVNAALDAIEAGIFV